MELAMLQTLSALGWAVRQYVAARDIERRPVNPATVDEVYFDLKMVSLYTDDRDAAYVPIVRYWVEL